tara:strand:- start:3200 stop:4471 length:1272 start_codon:yes stop_codon:yes gene_type:complete
MLRRTFCTVALVGLSLMPLSVVAQSNEKLNLLVGNWAVEPLTPWVKQFTEFTGIEVEVQGFPFRDLLQTIEVRGKAKATDVDAIFVDAPLVPSYAVRGLISSMGPYFEQGEAQEIWANAAIAAASWNGEVWAPPLNNSSQILYYNKDLLNASGIDAPSSDSEGRITWEQLVENAQTMVDADAGIWGMSFDQVSRYYQLQALPESAGGGSGVDAAGTSVEGMLTNEGWMKAAKFYYDLFNTWNISPKGVSPDQTQELFASGKAAYFVGGPWNIAAMVEADVNFGMALHPYFQGGTPKTSTNSWHIGVWNYTENKDAAAQLVRFLTASPEVAIDYVEQHGQLPAHHAALQNIAESPRYNSFPRNGIKLATYEAANTAVTRARTPAFLEFEEIVNNSFEDIRNGGDPATVLGEAEQRIQSAMRRYR